MQFTRVTFANTRKWLIGGVCFLGSVALVLALMTFTPAGAMMQNRSETRAAENCAHYAQNFTIGGTSGGRTALLTKTGGCGETVHVQFSPTSQPLDQHPINVTVCLESTSPVLKCENLQRWSRLSFTDNELREVAQINSGTRFYLVYTPDHSGTPSMSGRIIVKY